MKKCVVWLFLCILMLSGCAEGRLEENGKATVSKEVVIDEAVPDWGITLTAENITPTGLTIKCVQSGGMPSGELQTGSEYVLHCYKDNSWKKMNTIPEETEVAWTAESWMIPADGTAEWNVSWEGLYGALPGGQYRIGKSIMDFRGAGDYDTAMHYAKFEIE